MNVLIVHAHPEPLSFSSAMCRVATEQLRSFGNEVRVSDLYALKFNPVASAADFAERKDPTYLTYALEQRHAEARGVLAPDIRTELAKLLWCDLLILNFPMYWFSTPAILKGWFDRVLISGSVYGGKRFYDRGGLVGKKALAGITIGGQEHMFGEHGVHGPLEDMLKPLLRGTLAYTGMTVLPPYVAWHVPYVDEQRRSGMLQEYRDLMGQIDTMTPLEFPTLNGFDERLFPIRKPESTVI